MTDLFIDKAGNLSFVYDDDVALALQGMGTPRTRRASHVEPTADGRWTADLSPVAGRAVVLGPFVTRREALEAEADWLRDFLGSRPAANAPPITSQDHAP